MQEASALKLFFENPVFSHLFLPFFIKDMTYPLFLQRVECTDEIVCSPNKYFSSQMLLYFLNIEH